MSAPVHAPVADLGAYAPNITGTSANHAKLPRMPTAPPQPTELSDAQLAELRADLNALRAHLTAQITAMADETAPVGLDQPIGRLSRMEALQQQAMAGASKERLQRRVRDVDRAIERYDAGDYGYCVGCDEPVGYRRLKVVGPEVARCVRCQSAQES